MPKQSILEITIMRPVVFIVVVLYLFTTACKKNSNINSLPNAQFIVGNSFNFCGGDCAHFYALQDGKLYPDAITGQYNGSLSFKTTSLPNDKYLLVKQLFDSIPAFLLSHADTTFGCPDCSDGGAIHVWLKINGVTKYWNIDNFTEQNPAEIQPYVIKMKAILDKL